MNDITNKVRILISRHLEVSEDRITPTADFVRDLGADSLDSVEFLMAIEEAFGIEIPDDAAEQLHNLTDVVQFLSPKLKD